MSFPKVAAFIDALGKLERDRQVDAMLAAFQPDAELSNPNVDVHGGPDLVLRFWTSYRRSFGSIRSTFRHVVVSDGVAILEWTSTGQTAGGTNFSYDGVSVLEYSGDRIAHFRAYFDPAELGDQLEPVASHRSIVTGVPAP
jgi:limonene-1,2-epoxide hydrolase